MIFNNVKEDNIFVAGIFIGGGLSPLLGALLLGFLNPEKANIIFDAFFTMSAVFLIFGVATFYRVKKGKIK